MQSAAEPIARGIFDDRMLVQIFNDCFFESELTCLVGGFSEPIYQPSVCRGQPHQICYREDYFASALHEVAHWCIASESRRQWVDFGYWYAPDGRTPEQQLAFEKVECKPQALEWFFARACRYPFRVSVDNLSGGFAVPDENFSHSILSQIQRWQYNGLPERAETFFVALSQRYGTSPASGSLHFSIAELK
ncbi:MAG: elongation factor P hydroxylase [Alcanivorax sp.]|jgi:elongation factor P hydroxylase